MWKVCIIKNKNKKTWIVMNSGSCLPLYPWRKRGAWGKKEKSKDFLPSAEIIHQGSSCLSHDEFQQFSKLKTSSRPNPHL